MIPLFFFDFGYRLDRFKNFLIICGFRLNASAFSLVFRRFLPYFFAHMCACPCRIFVLKFKMRIIYRAIFLKIFTNNYPKSVSKINARLPTYTPMGYLQPFYALFRTKIIPHSTIKTSGKFKQKVIFNLHLHHTQTGDKIATFQPFTSS